MIKNRKLNHLNCPLPKNELFLRFFAALSRLAPKQDAEHTDESLVRSFNYFRGNVKNILVGNPKAAVIKHGQNGNIEFNAGFLQLANHYGFSPPLSTPNSRQNQRIVGYVKHNFFTLFGSLAFI